MHFIVSFFVNAAIWSQLLQRWTRKSIEIDRTPSRTWPLSCVVAGERRNAVGEQERKKKKRGSRGEARFSDVSRRPPFPCTREFNRGWNVLHLLRVSLLRIAASIPIDAVISAISDVDRSNRRVVRGCAASCSLSESGNLIIRRSIYFDFRFSLSLFSRSSASSPSVPNDFSNLIATRRTLV